MKKNINKLLGALLIFVFIINLSGCFNLSGSGTNPPSTNQSPNENQKLYETSEFSAIIPKNWEVIEPKEFTGEVPAETQVVFRNNVKNEDFTANLSIIRNSLQSPLSSSEYAKRVMNRQKSGLYDFHESKFDTIKINIAGQEEDTFYSLFEAKKAAEEKIVRYFQTYAVKGNTTYIITGATSPQESDTVQKDIEMIVKSFRVK